MIKNNAQTFSTARWKKISMRLPDLYDNFCEDNTGTDIP